MADPVSGTEFATTLNVSLTTPTPGATIWYTLEWERSEDIAQPDAVRPPLSLVSTTTVTAYATAGVVDSLVVSFTYTKRARSAPS